MRALFSLLVLLLGPAAMGETNLVTFGLEPDAEHYEPYLNSLAEPQAHRDGLLPHYKKLGAENYTERQRAFDDLLATPFLPREQVRQMASHDDPEIRYWSKRLYIETKGRNQEVLREVLANVAAEPVPGLLEPISKLIRQNADPGLRYSLRFALLNSATSNDVQWVLTDMKNHPTVEHLLLLERLLGKEAVPVARPFIDHRDEAVKMEACRLLLIHGDRSPLSRLVKMDDGTGELPSSASLLLRTVTGERFESAKAWRDWMEEHGATAELKPPTENEGVVHRRLIVAIWDTGKIFEYDETGKQLWALDVDNATALHGLPTGSKLIAGHADGAAVREFNMAGDVVWQVKVEGEPIYVQRLDTGNTIVGTEKHVYEINPAGKTVNTLELPERAWFCTRRMRNGNTLVTTIERKGLVELGPNGKELAFFPNEKRLRDARRLPNGNTLVCELDGRVMELDTNGKPVWKSADNLDPVNAIRLANGNTRVITKSGLIELTPAGKRIDLIKIDVHKTPNAASFF